MSRYKGNIGLAILVVIALMIMGIFLLIEFFPFVTKIIEIKTDVGVFVEIEDEGSSIITIMQSKKHDITYAEIMGDFRTNNHQDNIAEETESLRNVLGRLEASLSVYDESGNPIYGSGVERKIDIALPGNLRGKAGI